MTDKMREEFEAWAARRGLSLVKYRGGMYVSDRTLWASIAWHESRAALVVELPETELTGAIGMAHKAVTKRCRASIEAAGVRVKP